MHWREVSWVVDAVDRPLLEEALEVQGAVALSAHNATHEPSFEVKPGEDPEWLRVRIVALFEDAIDTDAVVQRVEAQFGHQVTAAESRRFEERDWVREWTQALQPQAVGNGLWVVPHGHAAPETATHVLRLDPGIAFGSGTHETTQLCLEWVAAHDFEGRRVVDFGCGSGILGIAALLRGADFVDACDIDPQAVEVTRDNARRNGVVDRMRVDRAPDTVAPPADVVLANVLLQALVDHAAQLATLCRAGGRIVLSGVLDAQGDLLRQAFAPWFDDFTTTQRNEWLCVVARRNDVR